MQERTFTGRDDLVKRIIDELSPIIEEKIRQILVGENPQTEPLESIEEVSIEIVEQPQAENSSKIDVEIAAVNQKVDVLLEQLQAFAYKEKLFNDLHEELQKHKNGLKRDIISPLLKSLIHQHGKVIDMYRFYETKTADETIDKAALFPTLLKEYKNLAEGLEDMLYDYDVETVAPKAGEEFNPRVQKLVQTVPTDNPDCDHKIERCVNIGFKDVSVGKLLKQPEVSVYKLSIVDQQNL